MTENRWSVPIEEIASRANKKVEVVARAITLQLFRAVVLRSPVDTGRFRANWNVAYGTPNYATNGSSEKNRGLGETLKVTSLPVGGVMYLSNGLPYARRLEYGWSKQAASGMVRITVAEFTQHVNAGLAAARSAG